MFRVQLRHLRIGIAASAIAGVGTAVFLPDPAAAAHQTKQWQNSWWQPQQRQKTRRSGTAPASFFPFFGLGAPGIAPQAAQARASVSAHCLPGDIRQALASVESKFGPVQIVSTHRPGARIRGSGHASLHSSCRAVDFRPAPGTYGKVAAELRRTWPGGVGTYSSGHIHIDNGAGFHWHSGR